MRLMELKLNSRLVMQVHDELIFESPKDENDTLLSAVQQSMENAVECSVPLKVNLKVGPDWHSI